MSFPKRNYNKIFQKEERWPIALRFLDGFEGRKENGLLKVKPPSRFNLNSRFEG